MDNEINPDKIITIYNMHYSPKDFANLNKPADNKENIVYYIVNKCMSLYQGFHHGIRNLALLTARLDTLLKYMGGKLVISIDNEKSPKGYIDIYVKSCALYSHDVCYLANIAEQSGCCIFINIDDKHSDDGETCLHILFKLPLTI